MTIIERLSESFASGYDVSYNSLVLLDSTHFAVAYRASSVLSGWGTQIATFSFDDTSYSITLIDTYFIGNERTYLSFIKLSTDTLVLASRNIDGNYGEIVVFSLSSYIISLSETYIYTYNKPYYNSLIRIDDYKFILAYGVEEYGGWVKTFEYDYGTTDISVIDYLEYNTDRNEGLSLVQISSTHYLLAVTIIDLISPYTTHNVLKVFSIDGNSDNITEITTFTHDTGTTYVENKLCEAGSDVLYYRFTLIYRTHIRNVLVLKSNYTISTSTATILTNLNNQGTSLIRYNDDYYILARRLGTSEGRITVFKRDNSFIFTVADDLTHHSNNINYNSLVKVSNSKLLLSFSNFYPTSPITGYNKIFEILNNPIVMII